MKNPKLFQNIRKNLPNFTPGEEKVAQYVVDNYQKAALLTSIEIGNEVDVSDTTVIRFANVIGYKGFTEFKKELKELVKKEITPREKLSNTIEELNKDNEYLLQLYNIENMNLKQTFEKLDFTTINKAIDLMNNDNKIFAMGLGLSSLAVHYLGYRLKRIQKNIIEIDSGAYKLVSQLSLLDNKDVFIAFDFPRYSRDTFLALKYAKEMDVTTILVTDSLINPLQEYSDLIILAYNECLGYTNSIVGTSLIVNLLSVGIILKDKNKSLDTLEKLEKFSEELGHCL